MYPELVLGHNPTCPMMTPPLPTSAHTAGSSLVPVARKMLILDTVMIIVIIITVISPEPGHGPHPVPDEHHEHQVDDDEWFPDVGVLQPPGQALVLTAHRLGALQIRLF